MSRAWRIEFEGALYHVLSRGNDQQEIFYDDEDRLLFIALIGEMAARFEVDVYAYTLMGNHYHLILLNNPEKFSCLLFLFSQHCCMIILSTSVLFVYLH